VNYQHGAVKKQKANGFFQKVSPRIAWLFPNSQEADVGGALRVNS
jgi:hypothetical protein